MKAILDKLADRLLSRLGLQMDFSVDLRASFVSPITPELFLGARPTPQHVGELVDLGVTHVASCLAEDERPRVAFLERDFEHLFLAVHDGIDEDIAEVFPRLFDFAASAREQDANAKLFVHCEVGVSRSASLVTALLMKAERLSFFDALRSVRDKRIQVLPNIGFASQLQRLEHELQPDSVARRPSSLAQYLREICNAPVELELLESSLEQHDYDAAAALSTIFGGEIPRVVQGVRK